jgi:hypothetical protein
VAQATAITLRVETTSGSLIPTETVTLPGTPVAPAGAPDGQTCAPDSIVGAVQAATSGDWNGTWDATNGWSIDRILNVNLAGSATSKWIAYVNHRWINDDPCHHVLAHLDDVLLYPTCTQNLVDFCFLGEPLWIFPYTATVGPGDRFKVQAYEVNTTFVNGVGTSGLKPSPDAIFATDTTYSFTDIYGYGIMTILQKGPVGFTLSSGNRVPDHGSVCVTDGADGYCGTHKPDPVPFDPADFCVTTGNDGECGTIDTRPPVGHITAPTQGGLFTTPVTLFKGTVDHDHSEIEDVQLRLKRQAVVKVTRYRYKRVTVKKRVKGKIKRVKVRKKKPYKKNVTRCYAWNVKTSGWALQKSCSGDLPAQWWFKADGSEAWSYEFLTKLPAGKYTLDAAAKDGAGNTDTFPELGRNRVTFTVK